MFTLLKPVGIPDRVIAYIGDLFGLYVGAYAFEESLGISSPTGEEMSPEQIAAMFREYTLSLPEIQSLCQVTLRAELLPMNSQKG